MRNGMQRKLKITLTIASMIIIVILSILLHQCCIVKKHFDQWHAAQDDLYVCQSHNDSDAEDAVEADFVDESIDVSVVSDRTDTIEETDSEEDDSGSDEENDFLVVNRSGEYLLDGAVSFYKQHNLQDAVIKLTDAWEPYNDWQLRQSNAKKTVEKKKIHKKKKTARLKTSKTIITKSATTRSRFSWPINPSYFWLSSRYGPRKHKNGSPGFHHGIDMAAARGTRIKAAAKGRVIAAGYTAGWGNNILIDHQDGRYKTRYAHLDKIRVYHGQYVTEESWIGDVGATGRVRKKGKDASHLHFEVYDNGKRVNPMLYVS